jgi:MerR family redox-sensitive transcriptional activator SoxR
VAFIRVSQNVGMPLAAIRAALSRLPEGRTPTREDWAAVSAFWRSDLDRRIRRLQRLRDDLTDCIGCGCLSLETCQLVNPDDVRGATDCPTPSLLDDDGPDAVCDDTTCGDAAVPA